MAASVAYKINGTADTSAIDKTKEALDKVAKAANGVKSAMTGFVVAKALVGVNAVLNGAKDSFMNFNNAVLQANKAFAQNATLSVEAVDNIRSAFDEISGNGLFSDSELNGAAALASQLGLNENQIKQVMDTATEMAAAGIMPLNDAVQKLSNSFNGNTDELKSLCPEIAGMTDEQIKAGGAVDALKGKFAGMRDVMNDTFQGRDTQFQNAFSGVQEAVGGLLKSFEFLAKGKLLKPLNDIGDWLKAHQTQILNFVFHLPEIFSVACNAIIQVLSRTFSKQGFLDLGRYIADSVTAWIPVMQASFTGLCTFVKDVFDATFGNVGRAVYNLVILPMKQWFANAINDLIKEHPKIVQALKTISGGKITLEEISVSGEKMQYADINKAGKDFKASIDSVRKTTEEAIKKQKEANNDFSATYSDITNDATAKIKALLNSDLPEGLQTALESAKEELLPQSAPAVTAPAVDFMSEQMAGELKNRSDSVFNALKAVSASLGELGAVAGNVLNVATENITKEMDSIIKETGGTATAFQMLQAGMTGLNNAMKSNIFGIILDIIVQIIGTFNSGMSKASESFGKVINLFSTILQPIIDAIAPIVEDLMKPLANILTSIGRIVGQMIQPLMELANDVLVPLMSGVSGIFNVFAQIAKCVAPIVKTFMNLLNKINVFAILLKGIAKVLELIGKAIAALYNYVLRPICNLILKIVQSVANGFIKMYNAIVGVFNGISVFGYHPFHISKAKEVNIGQLDKFDMDTDYYASGSDNSSSSGGSASGTASYTAQRDVNVNIYFDHSYVNGDSQQIAIMLAREIQQAEKMNLV